MNERLKEWLSPSPFIAGTTLQYALDSTSLGWFKMCPRLYQYSMIEGWRSKHVSIDLSFGLEYHKGLETYDRQRTEGRSHDEAVLHIVREALISTVTWEDLDPNKNRASLVRSLIWYCEEFADDHAKTLILDNGKPAVELSFTTPLEWKIGDQNYLLCGHIDRLVEFTGGTFVLDHKTSKATLSQSYFSNFEPDNQMSLYSLASQIVWKAPVRGVIIDAAQIAVGFTRFERGITYRTEAQLEEWLTDLRKWLDLAERYAEDGYYPMNDRSCRFCTFKKICSKDPSVRQVFLESDFSREEPWNPLKSR